MQSSRLPSLKDEWTWVLWLVLRWSKRLQSMNFLISLLAWPVRELLRSLTLESVTFSIFDEIEFWHLKLLFLKIVVQWIAFRPSLDASVFLHLTVVVLLTVLIFIALGCSLKAYAAGWRIEGEADLLFFFALLIGLLIIHWLSQIWFLDNALHRLFILVETLDEVKWTISLFVHVVYVRVVIDRLIEWAD